jgi:hypoxanthine phosphoribosyltransferase
VTAAEHGATGTPLPEEPPRSAVDDTRFAHASEAEMARILDFYDVRWDYEPTTFPILWNLDGDVVESFAPDFYLPEMDVFLEMTTLKQRLVRKKNRKLRRLRELYPDIRIKLFYARDFRAMMLKYGRLGLAESLSGTPGQVVPERAAVEVPTDDVPPLTPEQAAEDELPAVLVQEEVAPIAADSPTAPGTTAPAARPAARSTLRPGSRAASRTRTSRARRARVSQSSTGVEESGS